MKTMDKFINKVIMGDCLEKLKELEDNSVDSIVTDPPAGISFMGKSWDTDKGGRDNWIKWMQEVATECKRVLKPGGHAFVWTIPRTSHWTATAWENAGFEIRDVVAHVFGSGFPKSLNIGKAVDKLQGNERVITGSEQKAKPTFHSQNVGGKITEIDNIQITKGTSEWEGWGTALKPAREDWILMRKPLDKGLTITENCLKWGTGGINIDESRVKFEDTPNPATNPLYRYKNDYKQVTDNGQHEGVNVKFTNSLNPPSELGRFPANLILSFAENEYIIRDEITNEQKQKALKWIYENA